MSDLDKLLEEAARVASRLKEIEGTFSSEPMLLLIAVVKRQRVAMEIIKTQGTWSGIKQSFKSCKADCDRIARGENETV